MMEDNNPRIPPMEHVDQLLSVDPYQRDSQKQEQQRQKKKRHKDAMEEILKEENLRPNRDDGHVDYHA
jgi:hypothetical protein